MPEVLKYDEIGYWSEIKLDIIKDYASEYSRILNNQYNPSFYHIYIDAFAGAGKHKSKNTGEFIPGSPTNALNIRPAFKEYHFIDLNEQKIESLENIAGNRKDVYVHHGDCNQILLDKVLPKVKYEQYRRALCILDPYGLHLDWKVTSKIGQMNSIEIFLNFPVYDINRNVLRKRPKSVSPDQIDRMNKYWGDDSWRGIAYEQSPQMPLFGNPEEEKVSNEVIADAFRSRLKKIAGFNNVPKPIAMRNSQNAIIYYLFFASHKPVAENIVTYIFQKYANRRG